jgi:hypothetical protein
MCQALCPGSETTAFSMSGSDDALSRAVSLRGKPYSSLPNAFRYQKAFDESCSCKKEGQNWAQILRQAEGMLDQKRGDILVTAQKSEELSRPKAAQAPPPAPAPTTAQSKRAADKKAAEAAEAQEAVDQAAAAAPTASRESSGIGPQSIETSKVVGATEGPKTEVPVSNGAKRTVRTIAPNVIPVPQAKPQ